MVPNKKCDCSHCPQFKKSLETAIAEAASDILNKRKRHAPSVNISLLAKHVSVNSGSESSCLETIWE